MNMKKYRIGDIARITGIPEEKVRKYADIYDDLIPSRSMGRVRLYEENAVRVFRQIATLDEGGTGADAVRQHLGGGKPEKRSMRSGARPSGQKPAPPPAAPPAAMQPPPIQIPQERRETRMIETVALQEQQIKRLRAKVEEQEKRIVRLEEEIRGRLDLLASQNDAQQRQMRITGEWIDYFEKRADELAAGLNLQATSQDAGIRDLDARLDSLGEVQKEHAAGLADTGERIRRLERSWRDRLRDGFFGRE